MKKADAVVLKETKYIAGITLILSAILQSVLIVFKIWNYTHLLGNILGVSVAILNFFLMGVTVQTAVTKDEKEAKKLIKLSQSARLFGMLIIALIGHLIPFFNTWCILIPLLFPRIAIMLRMFLIKE